MISLIKILVQTCYKFDFLYRLINGSSDRKIMTRHNFWGGFCLNKFQPDCQFKLKIVHSFGFSALWGV